MRYQDKKRQLRMNRKQRSAVMQRFIRERPTSEQYTEACQWASARASTIHHRWAIDGSVVAFSPLISCAIFPGALDCRPLPAPLPQRLDAPFHHSSPQSRGWPVTSRRKERRKTRRADRRPGYSASSSETETTLAGTVDDRGKRRVRELSKPIRSTRATCWAEVTTTGPKTWNIPEHTGGGRGLLRRPDRSVAAWHEVVRCVPADRATPRHAVPARQDCPIHGTAGAGRRPGSTRAASTRLHQPEQPSLRRA
jgi:hypothetical protein